MNEILDHVDINPRKLGHGRGSAPYRRSDWTSRLWAMSKNGQFKTTRECARSRSWRSLSWTWLDSLELCGTPRSYASRFRNCALQRAPVRWTLTSEPTIGRSLRPCQSRNGATNSTTAEESFPGDVTQQFQVSTREQPKEHELTTWHPKQRTELTRENEAKASILLTPTESK